jgi:hypothetical protein
MMERNDAVVMEDDDVAMMEKGDTVMMDEAEHNVTHNMVVVVIVEERKEV